MEQNNIYYELLAFINQHGYKPDSNKDNVDRLIKGIQEGAIKSDAEGRTFFGDCSTQYYHRIKEQAYWRLIHHQFQYKSNLKSLPNIHDGIYRELAIVKLLANMNKRQMASYLLDKLLKKAKQYHVSEVVFSLIRLKIQYNAVYGKKSYRARLHRKLAEERDYYEKVLAIESQLEELYAELALIFLDRVELSKSEFDMLDAIEEKVLSYPAPYTSYRIDYFKYYLLVGIQEARNDFERLVDLSYQAIEAMSKYNLKHIPYLSLSSFYFRLIAVLIKRDHFEEAQESIAKAEAIVPKGTRNDFLLKVFKTTLFFHSKEYEKAAEVLHSIKKVNNLSEPDQENYLMYKAFADLFTGRKVRLGKLLNEVPIFSSHKRGQNIMVLTIQILVNLKRRELGNVADKVEALKRYAGRYLRNNDNYRSYLWITICVRLVQSKFIKKTFLYKAQKEIQALKDNPIGNYSKEIGAEVVRFEECLNLINNSL